MQYEFYIIQGYVSIVAVQLAMLLAKLALKSIDQAVDHSFDRPTTLLRYH